ncbi:MAG: hypothetical protein PW843_03305 [Azospirillaceae bacterium]|nr:hypothetical protein [Azospirillaceae bacterium]
MARGKGVQVAGGRFGFLQGFLLGLSAIASLGRVEFRPMSYSNSGLRDDWRAVGSDLRAAMAARKLNDRNAA